MVVLNTVLSAAALARDNRLRATMLYDWFSSLLILASEKDVTQDISVADIIDRFAQYSLPPQKQLLLMS